jgi:hypothetical protein
VGSKDYFELSINNKDNYFYYEGK